MSDDLVRGLRGEFLKCNCAAFSRSECCCDTVWPESLCREAAAAIERKDAALRMALEALEECSEDLKAEIDYRHGSPPRMDYRYHRDFLPISNAWKAIAKIKEALND